MKKTYVALLILITLMLNGCSGNFSVIRKIDTEPAAKSENITYAEETEPPEVINIPTETKAPETQVPETKAPETDPPEPTLQAVDPFTGLAFVYTGVSPFVNIGINSAGCSEDVQVCVVYTITGENEAENGLFANGDSFRVTAELNKKEKKSAQLTLSKSEAVFTVENQPEYVTSLDGLDLTYMASELDDYVKSKAVASVKSSHFMDVLLYRYPTVSSECTYNSYISTDKVELIHEYLLSLKPQNDTKYAKKKSSFNNFYNCREMMYKISITVKALNVEKDTAYIYACFYLYNIIKYPDGTVKWGISDPNLYSFDCLAYKKGYDDMINCDVTMKMADYNVTEY